MVDDMMVMSAVLFSSSAPLSMMSENQSTVVDDIQRHYLAMTISVDCIQDLCWKG